MTLVCRFCSAPLTRPVVDLGLSPLSNALLDPEDLDKKEPRFPLRPLVCEKCWLVQLPEFTRPEHIFRDYVYLSSYSTTWLRHVEHYAAAMIERLDLCRESLVVEVGSNDGHLLSHFQQRNVPVLGIEPAANVGELAAAKGIRTEVAFLGEQSAATLRARYGQADLIAGNNVLAHVPNLNDFVAGLRTLLKSGGTITLEFPHLMRLVEHTEFDTIYHEHFSYFSLAVAQRVFAAHSLSIHDVDELTTHGGSLRIYAAHASAAVPVSPGVRKVLAAEQSAGLERVAVYESFAARVRQAKAALLGFLREARELGKTVAGYGAPAKATTLLNYCGVDSSLLPYTVDRNPVKRGKYIPGVRIPIEHPDRILERKPDYVLILPWNWTAEIVEQMSAVRSWGGSFVTPVPSVSVL